VGRSVLGPAVTVSIRSDSCRFYSEVCWSQANWLYCRQGDRECNPNGGFPTAFPHPFCYRAPKRKSVMSNTGLPELWAWDLYPLGRGAWTSRQIRTYCLPGHTVWLTDIELIERRVPFLDSPTAWRDGRTQAVRTRCYQVFYLPTEHDLSIVRRCYPEADPNQPAWARIEADLIAAGRNARELSTFKAPTLIKLLDMARITPARAREQAPLSAQPEPQVEVESSEAEPVGATKTSPFSGGKMVFYPDRVDHSKRELRPQKDCHALSQASLLRVSDVVLPQVHHV
jgi:hypothetical protein